MFCSSHLSESVFYLELNSRLKCEIGKQCLLFLFSSSLAPQDVNISFGHIRWFCHNCSPYKCFTSSVSSLSHALPEPLCDVAMSLSPRMCLYTFKYTPNLRVTRDQHRHLVGMNVKWAGNQLGTTKKRSECGFFFFF